MTFYMLSARQPFCQTREGGLSQTNCAVTAETWEKVEFNEEKVSKYVRKGPTVSSHLPGDVPASGITCVRYVANSVAKGHFHFKTLIEICVFQVGLDENQRCQVSFLF